MIKSLIKKNLNKMGYDISKIPSLENQIKNGYYKWLQDFGIKTIIDVGANKGDFALLINKILPDAYIYSFEPITSCFIELQRSTNKIKNIKHFNYALGENEEEKIFYENDFSPSSSFLKIKDQHISSFPYTANSKSHKTSIRTLNSFINSFELNSKVLLKLDVQGYELNVLKGAKKILSNIEIIITEVSFIELYEGQPLFHDIYEYLYEQGFKYHSNFEQMNDPQSNRALQADAIFIRE